MMKWTNCNRPTTLATWHWLVFTTCVVLLAMTVVRNCN